MIRKSDVQWWVLEARRDASAAVAIIEELANRLAELDEENERLRGEVIRLSQRETGGSTAGAESAQLTALQSKVETLQGILKEQASAETAVVLVSEGGALARVPLSQARLRLRDGRPLLDRVAVLEVRDLVLARPQDDLLIVTSLGRVIKPALHQVPYLMDEGSLPTDPAVVLEEGEWVTGAVAVARPPRFWTFVTRRGYVQQLLRLTLEKAVDESAPRVRSPIRSDVPVTLVDGDRGDLLLVTRWGKVVRFPQRAILGPGVQALELEPDDEVVGAVSLPEEGHVLLLTAAGCALRRDTARLAARVQPGGSGRPWIQAYDVMAVVPYAERGKLLYLTYRGRLVAVPTASIPLQDRTIKGGLLEDLANDPAVAVVWVPGALL